MQGCELVNCTLCIIKERKHLPVLVYEFNASRADTRMVQGPVLRPFGSTNPAYVD